MSLFDQGVTAVIKLAPSILAFLEKQTGVSASDFTLGHELSCMTIAGLNLDGSWCTHSTYNHTKAEYFLNYKKTKWSATVVDTNVYGNNLSYSNLLDFDQTVEGPIQTLCSNESVYGFYGYCVRYNELRGYCAEWAYTTGYHWQTICRTQKIPKYTIVSQTLSVSLFDFYLDNSLAFESQNYTISLHDEFGYGDYSASELSVNGSLPVVDIRKMDLDLSLQTDNQVGALIIEILPHFLSYVLCFAG